MTRARAPWAVLGGALLAGAYLAGAAASGGFGPLTSRPLLDGLAPPPPYRWVKPPPELAAGNKRPGPARATVRLGPSGSEASAIATTDGQASLVLVAGSIEPSPRQTEVAVSVEPVDPGELGPAPPGLVLAGNAYRVRLAYEPSGKRVAALSGNSTVSLSYPLLPIPITSPFDFTMLASRDGRSWAKQQSRATPGTHQVSATLSGPAYVVVAVPPASQAPPSEPSNRTAIIAGAAASAAVLVVIAAVVLARRLVNGRDLDDDYDDLDDQDQEGGR